MSSKNYLPREGGFSMILSIPDFLVTEAGTEVSSDEIISCLRTRNWKQKCGQDMHSDRAQHKMQCIGAAAENALLDTAAIFPKAKYFAQYEMSPEGFFHVHVVVWYISGYQLTGWTNNLVKWFSHYLLKNIDTDLPVDKDILQDLMMKHKNIVCSVRRAKKDGMGVPINEDVFSYIINYLRAKDNLKWSFEGYQGDTLGEGEAIVEGDRIHIWSNCIPNEDGEYSFVESRDGLFRGSGPGSIQMGFPHNYRNKYIECSTCPGWVLVESDDTSTEFLHVLTDHTYTKDPKTGEARALEKAGTSRSIWYGYNSYGQGRPTQTEYMFESHSSGSENSPPAGPSGRGTKRPRTPSPTRAGNPSPPPTDHAKRNFRC